MAAAHRFVVVISAIVLLVLIAYVAAFYCVLAPYPMMTGSSGVSHEFLEPAYRVGGSKVERLFAPMLWIDFRLRREYWAVKSYDVVPGTIRVRIEYR